MWRSLRYGRGKAVYDPKREQEKIAAVRSMAEGGFMKEAVGELFLQMMTLSRRYQYRLMEQVQSASDFGFQRVEDIEKKQVRIAYQGLEGAYSHAAVIQFFGEQADMFHVRRFEDAAKAVFEGRADYAVLPIENSSAGAVSDNYDLLLKYENYIVLRCLCRSATAFWALGTRSFPILEPCLPILRH